MWYTIVHTPFSEPGQFLLSLQPPASPPLDLQCIPSLPTVDSMEVCTFPSLPTVDSMEVCTFPTVEWAVWIWVCVPPTLLVDRMGVS